MSKLTRYLIFSFGVIILYTIAEFLVSMTTGMSHDTLTTCLYAFFGTEVGACCLIRIIDRDKPTQEQQPSEFDGTMDDIQEEESYG